MKVSSFYLHFPFCEVKCHYCDFYSLAASRFSIEQVDLFQQALAREIQIQSDPAEPFQVETLFLGGGTPSMTSPTAMAGVFEEFFKAAHLLPNYEWTMEANPSSLTAQNAKDYRSLGVNRVSLGVQSTHDHLLKLLGRVHDSRQATLAIEGVFEAGIENLSVDLICGVPGQSLKDLESDLTNLTRFPIQHLSCYLLTLPKSHPMASQLPNEDTQLEHLLLVHDFMEAFGFEHYEISNFARPGKRAVHNTRYWQGHSYLSFGPSAHSFDSAQGRRWKNVSSLARYTDRLLNQSQLPQEESETLTPSQKELEKWMLALRMSDGIPKDWLVTAHQKSLAKSLMEAGLLQNGRLDQSRLSLTARGFALSDQVILTLSPSAEAQ